MKKQLIFAAISMAISHFALAQEETKLTIPSTPAFSILNYEPTSVMRPTSNKDLAADVLNSFDKNGKLLMNLGLEVSPYWLKSRSALTREEYLMSKGFQTVLQSLSLSAATVKDSASGNNKLGVGIRLKVLNGQPVDDFNVAEKLFKQTESITSAISRQRNPTDPTMTIDKAIDSITTDLSRPSYQLAESRIDNVRVVANTIKSKYPDTKDGITKFVEELVELVQKADSTTVKNLADNAVRRKGLIVELAGASAFNSSNKNEFERIGGWASVSNYVSANDLFTFTVRGMYQNRDTTTANYDAGLSYLKKGERYNVSVECMARWYTMKIPLGQDIFKENNDFTYRVAFQGSYLISKQLSINLSFGKDFSNTSITASGYFSMLGFNYSIFNKL